LLNNPPHPKDAEILDEPGAADASPILASDGGASGADAVESAGGRPSVAEDSEESSPLCVKRALPLNASGRDAAGDGDDLPAVVPPIVPCPPSAAPKKRKFGILLRPGAAPAGLVWLSAWSFCCSLF